MAKRKQKRGRGTKRKVTIASLKRKLWKLVSEYIKLRDRTGNYYTCSTCKKKIPVSEGRRVNAGHFFSFSRSPAIRYNEYNIHVQCAGCNMNQGEQYLMYLYIKDKYGQRVINRLLSLKQKEYVWTKKRLEKKISEYQRKLQKYKKEK